MADILGVHGVGNYLPGVSVDVASTTIAKRWTESLGVRDRSVSIAYYSDLLRGPVAQGDLNPEQMPLAHQKLILGWIQTLGCDLSDVQGRATLPLRQALQWVAERWGLDSAMLSAFTVHFFGEVVTYFEKAECRSEVRDRINKSIAGCEPRIIVAHSLGSVVSYEALWEAGPEVEMLITLGSPLGLPDVVFDRLAPFPSGGRGRKPKRVGQWINIADPGDIVAVPRYLRTKFDGLLEDIETVIDVFDFHRVSRYLSAQVTRQRIRDQLSTS